MILKSKIFGNNGQPLLILHGLFGMSDNWTYFGKYWANNYYVHLIDIRNHGNSFHSNEMDYLILSKDIISYIKYYKLSNPILIGHSMGGKIVMHIALNYPFISSKIIIVDIAPKNYPPYHKKIIDIIKKINLDIIEKRNDLEKFLSNFFLDKTIKSLLSKNLYRKNNGKFAFKFYLEGIEKNYKKLSNYPIQFKKYKKLILFITGSKSNYISKNDYFIIKKYFPLSKIITIEGAGHCVHSYMPNTFCNIVQEFINLTPQAGFEPATP